ncbi:11245_t:CDS:1, partial [Entrophospora sp. SA101]
MSLCWQRIEKIILSFYHVGCSRVFCTRLKKEDNGVKLQREALDE